MTTAAPAAPPSAPPDEFWRLSVDDYHAMIRAGILKDGDPVELLEGWLVVKMTKYSPHTFSTQTTRERLEAVLPAEKPPPTAERTDLSPADFLTKRAAASADSKPQLLIFDQFEEVVTLDPYDQILQKMGLEQGGPTPPGAISHFVTKTDDGVRVVDVWESQEVFQRFAEEQIGRTRVKWASRASPRLASTRFTTP